MAKCLTPEIASVIATGNFIGKDYGLSSNTGYTIALQRTNMFQLAAQFTSICKFSLSHYSKNMRKFYAESWGMIVFSLFIYFVCMPFYLINCYIL